jgi:membrane-bound lytic murein transglycosylase MltF
VLNKVNYDKILGTASEADRLQMMFSAYNGGLGGIIKDRHYCRAIKGCNPDVWYGNVETHSLKPKTKLSGYSISAFSINRDYVHNIYDLDKRRKRYLFLDQ